MQTRQISTLLVCFCILKGANHAQGQVLPLMARDALVGKWTATVSPDDNNGKEFTDTLTVKGGKFSSSTQEKDGYEAAAYEDSPAPLGFSAKFTVTLKNKAGDTAVWAGFSTGSELSGTLVVTKKDGAAVTYTFKASKG